MRSSLHTTFYILMLHFNFVTTLCN